jgi:hypothetical protein
MNGTYRPLVFLYLADKSNLLAQDSKPELKDKSIVFGSMASNGLSESCPLRTTTNRQHKIAPNNQCWFGMRRPHPRSVYYTLHDAQQNKRWRKP